MRNFPKALVLVVALGLALTGTAKELSSVVQDYVKMFEASAKKPTPSCYPELADRVLALFPTKGSRKFESWSIENGVRKKGAVIYVQGNQVEIVAAKGEWNFSTDDEYVYEWKTGEKNGIRIKRVNEELVGFLYYETDPSWIMASLYADYLQSPGSFRVSQTPDGKAEEFALKKPVEGFEAVYATRSPLWFYGFRSQAGEIRFSGPEDGKEIPAAVLARRSKIVFKESEETLQQHMVFL